MDFGLLSTELPVGCQVAMHDDNRLEVFRDLQNGNRYSQEFDPTTMDEDDIAEAVFNELIVQKYGDDRTQWPEIVPTYTPGATIDI